ncbi:mobilome CxxCx(11)CxxC protein [Longispora sp. NPDC051575]|uniref:mobilome CxxCx(11)CxxC protein n=1 Tax=Longispora sp. NPDC051575 TaxID=3154943 RepID=UPI00341ED0E1
MVSPQATPGSQQTIPEKCRDNAIHTFGTSIIFQRRARRIKLKLQLQTYFGILLPLITGGIVLSFGTTGAFLPLLISAFGVLGLPLLAISLWSLVAGWSDQLTAATDSVSANEILVKRYSDLADSGMSATKVKIEFDLIQLDDHNRKQLDLKQHVSEKEMRFGLRAGLRQFQRKCGTCQLVPTSLKPTSCGVCGDF